jgi:hypothetical protein
MTVMHLSLFLGRKSRVHKFVFNQIGDFSARFSEFYFREEQTLHLINRAF